MQVSMKISARPSQLDELIRRSQDIGSVMSGISERMRGSVVRNFEVGGRFERAGSITGGTTRWKPVKGNSTPLVRSGMLRDSIRAMSTDDTALVVTGLEYAAIHNNGGPIRSYARSELFTRNRGEGGQFVHGTTAGRGQTYGDSVRTMPARPYMVIQDADIAEAKSMIRAHLLGGVR